jgi:hypothetical protein
LNFLHSFLKKSQISNFIRIHPVGAELLHEDGWTDMMMLLAAIRNFANAHKKLATPQAASKLE